MLNSETKKRIDDCRDILVGKVPDPKSQIEQITIALIYKFMDDMDNEAVELGGERRFFSDGFAKYAWSKLFRPDITGDKRVDLYREAIEKMEENPHVPQLFRDIFKNAFLPYRDPETLREFLKYINLFRYDHSEQLGDAFEYLLSVLGSQGDAGQFRTPRHIIDFMVELVDPGKKESILDPACGTAGFLISSYKHILKQNSSNFDEENDTHAFELHGVKLDELTADTVKKYKGDKLTPDERIRLINNIKGYDISPDMVRLSLVNLYLHGFSDPHIFEYDTLTSEERWNEYYDVVLANPPFMSPKGGILPHKRFGVESKRSEVLFVDYIAEHLTVNGRAAVIVPEGIIFQSGTAYKKLRKMLVEDNFLLGVISLPAGMFNPYSGVKTSILWLDKQRAKKTDKILFVKIENDGFDLGAQRRPIKLNDLPEAFKGIRAYRESLDSGVEFGGDGYSQFNPVEKSKVAENGDYNLSGERYVKNLIHTSKYKLVTISEVCLINPKKSDVNLNEDEEISFVPMRDLSENNISFKPKEIRKIKDVIRGAYTYFKDGDVILAKVTPCFENGKAGIASDLKQSIGFGSSEFYVLRTNDKILPELIYYFTTSTRFKDYAIPKMTGTGGLQRVPKPVLSEFTIPLPPLSVQEEIVAELDSYQKIIDGARQVVENYKPHIDIDPDWPLVELGKVCNFVRGPFGGSLKKEIFVEEGYAVYEQSHAIYNQFTEIRYFIDDDKFTEMKRFEVFPGDLIMSCSGTMGKVAIVPASVHKGIINQALLKLTVNENLNNEYLKLWMESNNFQESLKSNVYGAAIQNVASVKVLQNLKIPFPTIEIQKQIVAKIEREQDLVKANKELIAIYEQKIKDHIARVWGK